MTTCHWVVEGIGLSTDDLYPHLNRQKCYDIIKANLPEGEEMEDAVETFDVDMYFYGELFQNLAEMMVRCCDVSGQLNWGSTGDGSYYLLYAPSYPWQWAEDSPTSVAEVHQLLIACVKRVSDLSDADIEAMIDDDLYEYGGG